MDQRTLGVLVIALGAIAVLAGFLILAGGLGWFGRLPGDVRVESGNARLYVPIASMLVVSAVLTLVLVRRFL